MSAPEPMPAGRTDNENLGDDAGGGASGNGDAALAMYVVFLPHLDALAVPVAVYMLALCAMASFSLMARPACLALSLGGLAFVASDTMLGIDRFLSPFSGSGYAIWLSYAIAQVSIAAGILLSDDARPQERGA
jgi:uncharacterized membrane protein YhhN